MPVWRVEVGTKPLEIIPMLRKFIPLVQAHTEVTMPPFVRAVKQILDAVIVLSKISKAGEMVVVLVRYENALESFRRREQISMIFYPAAID